MHGLASHVYAQTLACCPMAAASFTELRGAQQPLFELKSAPTGGAVVRSWCSAFAVFPPQERLAYFVEAVRWAPLGSLSPDPPICQPLPGPLVLTPSAMSPTCDGAPFMLCGTSVSSLRQAMTYLRSRRSIANPHEGFMAQLEAFEGKLKVEQEAAIADGQEKKVRVWPVQPTHTLHVWSQAVRCAKC